MTRAYRPLQERLSRDLAGLDSAGLTKPERVITTPQGARIEVAGGRPALNLCANNYLGLSSHPKVVAAARAGLERWGYGMSSVRFICGTQAVHKELEARLSEFLGVEDTILYASCFDANGGLFEAFLSDEDAIISDALNHASIIDGVRLCKAQRFRYGNDDMADLERQLVAASGARTRLVATDGVFSMDGIVARLDAVCELAERHDALVMVDDSHAVGFMGAAGRGSHEHRGVMGRVDVITGTLGKALGGASGGYVAGPRELVAWLRQRSRPYLFSNSLAPAIAAASIAVLDLLASDEGAALRHRLFDNCLYFRRGLDALGFELVAPARDGDAHPIIPVMLGDAKVASDMAERLLAEGVYVIGFSYPVVPKGQARIRTQMSAALGRDDLDRALDAFAKVGRAMEVIR